MWCGTETIGDRRAGLSEIQPGPARGELSSPSSLIHPGEDRPMSRRVAEQLSRFGAVQLRCAKGDRVKSGAVSPGTTSFVLPRSVRKTPRSMYGPQPKRSKPVTVTDYSCIIGAGRGFRQVSTSSEK